MQSLSSYHHPVDPQTSESDSIRSCPGESRPAGRHLSETDIARYVDNAVDSLDRTVIHAHLAGCSVCARTIGDVIRSTRDLRMIPENRAPSEGRTEMVSPDSEIRKKVESLVLKPEHAFDRTTRRRRMIRALRIGIPVAAVAFFWIFRLTGSDPVSRFRSSDTPRSIHLTLPRDGSILGDKDWRFEVEEIEDVLAYRFTISTLSGDLTYRDERAAPAVTVPDSIPRTPGRYAWTVDVVLKDGRVLKSDMGTFVANR